MRNKKRGWTLVDVLVLIGVAVVILVLFPCEQHRVREKANRSSCKGGQRQLMLACITYRDGQGMAVSFPPQDGSDFLLHLYTSEEISEPGLFICPSSGDSNGDGEHIALGRGSLPTNACSYAGRRNRDQTDYPGIYNNEGASETPASSDDDEGSRKFNHGDSVIAGFVDGHVEELALSDPRLGAERMGEGLLDPLGN